MGGDEQAPPGPPPTTRPPATARNRREGMCTGWSRFPGAGTDPLNVGPGPPPCKGKGRVGPRRRPKTPSERLDSAALPASPLPSMGGGVLSHASTDCYPVPSRPARLGPCSTAVRGRGESLSQPDHPLSYSPARIGEVCERPDRDQSWRVRMPREVGEEGLGLQSARREPLQESARGRRREAGSRCRPHPAGRAPPVRGLAW